MLMEISNMITPEIYEVIYRMGHMDELVIADANYLASALSTRVVYSYVPSNHLLLAELWFVRRGSCVADGALCPNQQSVSGGKEDVAGQLGPASSIAHLHLAWIGILLKRNETTLWVACHC